MCSKIVKKFKLKCRGNLNVEETREKGRERIKEFQFQKWHWIVLAPQSPNTFRVMQPGEVNAWDARKLLNDCFWTLLNSKRAEKLVSGVGGCVEMLLSWPRINSRRPTSQLSCFQSKDSEIVIHFPRTIPFSRKCSEIIGFWPLKAGDLYDFSSKRILFFSQYENC